MSMPIEPQVAMLARAVGVRPIDIVSYDFMHFGSIDIPAGRSSYDHIPVR
jgi:hypothetical protein